MCVCKSRTCLFLALERKRKYHLRKLHVTLSVELGRPGRLRTLRKHVQVWLHRGGGTACLLFIKKMKPDQVELGIITCVLKNPKYVGTYKFIYVPIQLLEFMFEPKML